MINGILKIRLSGSEKRVFAKWASAYSRSAKVRYRPPMILHLATAISLLISLLGNIALYFAAAKTGISVADYMAFVTSYGVLSGAFGTLAAMVGVVASIQPMFEMARPILEAEPESKQGKKIIESIGGNISVSDLSFRYTENGPDIISISTSTSRKGNTSRSSAKPDAANRPWCVCS
jgi:ABC-type bacteriocin/lantibiotic exporter with double-glycine peptidase domain